MIVLNNYAGNKQDNKEEGKTIHNTCIHNFTIWQRQKCYFFYYSIKTTIKFCIIPLEEN